MKNKLSTVVAGSVLALGVVAIAPKVNAQTTPVDQLKTEVNKLSDVYDQVLPVAIGAMAFSIGAVIIKRIAFS